MVGVVVVVWMVGVVRVVKMVVVVGVVRMVGVVSMARMVGVVGVVGVVRMVGVVEVVRMVRVVGVVRVVSMVGVVRMVGEVRMVKMVTLLAEHYFVQIIVGWWSLLLDMLWVLWEYVYLVPTRTTTIHESLVNRLTYGCKPVKMLSVLDENQSSAKKVDSLPSF